MPITKDKPVVKVSEVEEVVEYVPFDPWQPVLKNSPSLHTTPEQELYIREILEICCSDSAFAKKAYAALQYILTGAAPVAPVLSSLSPNTAVVATPVTLVATGTGFTSTSVISVSGSPLATTFVSDTELSTAYTSPGTPGVVPVAIITDGLISESVDFTVTDIVLLAAPSDKLGHELEKQKEESIKNKVENFNTPHGQDKK